MVIPNSEEKQPLLLKLNNWREEKIQSDIHKKNLGQQWPNRICLDEGMELVGGGSVIKGAYPI